MASVGKWIPPLPAGWEARFDHNQRAYFFINHSTRTTTWDDPRFPKQQAAPAPAQPSQAASAARTLGHSGASSGDQEAHPLQELSPSHRSRSHSNSRPSHHQQQTESTLSDRHTAAAVDRLKKDFPNATKELIGDLYRLCHENERETREQLSDLGFSTQGSGGANSGSGQTAAATEAPARREPTEFEKTRMLNQLIAAFPNVDPSVIRISLDTCHYNVEESKRLIEAFEKDQKDNATRAAQRSRASSTSGTSGPRVTSPAVLEPASLDRDASFLPVGLSSDSGQTGARGNSQQSTPTHTSAHSARTPTHAARSAAGGGDGPSTSRGGSPSHQPQQHARAKQVTNTPVRAQRPKPQPTTVVTAQPARRQQQTGRHSAFHTDAKGADPSLRKGPDQTLLSTSYTQALGSNRSIALGPDPQRVLGPQGACGPDISLRCGPLAEHRQENTNNNILVTNI